METKDVPKYSPLRQILPQILAVSVKNVLLLVHGMSLGFPTILIPGVSGKYVTEPIIMTIEEISWIGSINLIFVPLGCLVSGMITQLIGRKRAMQFVTVPFLASWILCYYSKSAWHIFLAVSMLGWSGGLLEAPVLTYVAEITQPRLRGILSSTSTMTVSLGILSQFVFGSLFHWRTVTIINGVIPIIAFILLMFVPETPVWLLSKKRTEEAKKSIAWLRGWTSVEFIQDEFQELYKQIQINEEHDNSIHKIIINKIKNIKLFAKRNFIYPCLLVSFTFCLGHFNGYSPFQVYAISIFKSMNAPINEYYSTIIVGVMQLIGAIVSVSLIHVLGRRKLNFISLLGSGLCMLVTGTYAYLYNIRNLDDVKDLNGTLTDTVVSEPYSWIPLTSLILFGFLCFVGIRILPWVLIGEIFAADIRATASGISAGLGYVFGFLANKTFLSMISQFSLPVVFWFYAAVGILGIVVLYLFLPETEGKTLHEISEHFAGRVKLRNSIRRGNVNPSFEMEDHEDRIESKL